MNASPDRAAAPRYEEEYFAANYRDYERQNPPRKLAFYRRLAELAVGGRERPRVLDLGCAFGRFLAALPPAWELAGVDASRFAIADARRRLPDARLAVARGPEIPFPGPFDLVTSFDVLEHLPELDATRHEVAAKLAPGGAFLFVVPVYDGPTGPLIRLLDRDPTHLHKRPRRFWLDWAAADFAIEDWLGIARYLLPAGPYLHLATRRLRNATPAVAILARRGG